MVQQQKQQQPTYNVSTKTGSIGVGNVTGDLRRTTSTCHKTASTTILPTRTTTTNHYHFIVMSDSGKPIYSKHCTPSGKNTSLQEQQQEHQQSVKETTTSQQRQKQKDDNNNNNNQKSQERYNHHVTKVCALIHAIRTSLLYNTKTLVGPCMGDIQSIRTKGTKNEFDYDDDDDGDNTTTRVNRMKQKKKKCKNDRTNNNNNSKNTHVVFVSIGSLTLIGIHNMTTRWRSRRISTTTTTSQKDNGPVVEKHNVHVVDVDENDNDEDHHHHCIELNLKLQLEYIYSGIILATTTIDSMVHKVSCFDPMYYYDIASVVQQILQQSRVIPLLDSIINQFHDHDQLNDNSKKHFMIHDPIQKKKNDKKENDGMKKNSHHHQQHQYSHPHQMHNNNHHNNNINNNNSCSMEGNHYAFLLAAIPILYPISFHVRYRASSILQTMGHDDTPNTVFSFLYTTTTTTTTTPTTILTTTPTNASSSSSSSSIPMIQNKVVTIVQPSYYHHQIHASDLHLVMEYMNQRHSHSYHHQQQEQETTLSTSDPDQQEPEYWIPLCLPRLNSSRYMYCYTHSIVSWNDDEKEEENHHYHHPPNPQLNHPSSCPASSSNRHSNTHLGGGININNSSHHCGMNHNNSSHYRRCTTNHPHRNTMPIVNCSKLILVMISYNGTTEQFHRFRFASQRIRMGLGLWNKHNNNSPQHPIPNNQVQQVAPEIKIIASSSSSSSGTSFVNIDENDAVARTNPKTAKHINNTNNSIRYKENAPSCMVENSISNHNKSNNIINSNNSNPPEDGCFDDEILSQQQRTKVALLDNENDDHDYDDDDDDYVYIDGRSLYPTKSNDMNPVRQLSPPMGDHHNNNNNNGMRSLLTTTSSDSNHSGTCSDNDDSTPSSSSTGSYVALDNNDYILPYNNNSNNNVKNHHDNQYSTAEDFGSFFVNELKNATNGQYIQRILEQNLLLSLSPSSYSSNKVGTTPTNESNHTFRNNTRRLHNKNEFGGGTMEIINKDNDDTNHTVDIYHFIYRYDVPIVKKQLLNPSIMNFHPLKRFLGLQPQQQQQPNSYIFPSPSNIRHAAAKDQHNKHHHHHPCGYLRQCISLPFLRTSSSTTLNKERIWNMYQKLNIKLRLSEPVLCVNESIHNSYHQRKDTPISTNTNTNTRTIPNLMTSTFMDNIPEAVTISKDCPTLTFFETPPPPPPNGITPPQITYMKNGEELFFGMNGIGYELYLVTNGSIPVKYIEAAAARLVRKIQQNESTFFVSQPLTWNY